MDQYRENTDSSAPEFPNNDFGIPEKPGLDDRDIQETKMTGLEKDRFVERPQNLDELKEKPIDEVLEKFKDEAGELKPAKLTHDEKIERDNLRKTMEQVQELPHETEEIDYLVEKISGEKEKFQVEQILRIAEHDGFEKAMKVLKKVKDPYVIDLAHDLLSVGGLWKRFR